MRQQSSYVAVAGLSAASDWLVFAFISTAFPAAGVVFAQAPARLTGGAVAFLLHRLWSFRDQEGRGLGTEAGRFIALYIFSFVLSLTTVHVMVEFLGANRYWSKGFADVLCFIVNFVVMKYYVFASAQNLAEAANQLGIMRRA